MATCTATTPSKKLAQNQQQGTLSVEECDGDPKWKHDVPIDLVGISLWDCDHVFLRFVLFHEGVMLVLSLLRLFFSDCQLTLDTYFRREGGRLYRPTSIPDCRPPLRIVSTTCLNFSYE